MMLQVRLVDVAHLAGLVPLLVHLLGSQGRGAQPSTSCGGCELSNHFSAMHYGDIFEDNSPVYDTGELFIPLLQCTQCIRYRGIFYTIPLCLEFKINIFSILRFLIQFRTLLYFPLSVRPSIRPLRALHLNFS